MKKEKPRLKRIDLLKLRNKLGRPKKGKDLLSSKLKKKIVN